MMDLLVAHIYMYSYRTFFTSISFLQSRSSKQEYSQTTSHQCRHNIDTTELTIMTDSLYDKIKIPNTSITTNTEHLSRPKKRRAPTIISPITRGKQTIRENALSEHNSEPTRTAIDTPQVAAVVPTLFVHILFDGTLADSITTKVVTNGESTTTSNQPKNTTSCGAGAGALVTIVSMSPPASSSSLVSSLSSNHESTSKQNHHETVSDSDKVQTTTNSMVKSYRIRQYYDPRTMMSTSNSNGDTTDDCHTDTLNRFTIYYVALSAALRVILKHLRDIQPIASIITPTPSSSPSSIPPALRINCRRTTTTKSATAIEGRQRRRPKTKYSDHAPRQHPLPLQPLPPPIYKIQKLQIEGSCHALIMDTIHFLSHYPITSTSSTTFKQSTIDPILKRQFDTCYDLLRQLSYYYYCSPTTNHCAAGRNSRQSGTPLGLTRLEPEWNVIPRGECTC